MSNPIQIRYPLEQLRPREGFFLVRVDPPEEETAGGVLLPKGSAERPNSGEIVATNSLKAPVGIRVLYGRYSGTQFDVGGALHVLLQEDDILFTVSEVSA